MTDYVKLRNLLNYGRFINLAMLHGTLSQHVSAQWYESGTSLVVNKVNFIILSNYFLMLPTLCMQPFYKYLAKINTFQLIEEKYTKVGVSNLSDFRQVFTIKNTIFTLLFIYFVNWKNEIKIPFYIVSHQVPYFVVLENKNDDFRQ